MMVKKDKRKNGDSVSMSFSLILSPSFSALFAGNITQFALKERGGVKAAEKKKEGCKLIPFPRQLFGFQCCF
jgi:hypothetical protein